jgi:hypothetical protein
MSTPEEQPQKLSRDATHSTYSPAPEEGEPVNPPPGPSVIQELGLPSGAAPAPTSTKGASSKASGS